MENKLSIGKILLTTSLVLLLVVLGFSLGLLGLSNGSTTSAPEMGEVVAHASSTHENHALCVGESGCNKPDCTHTVVTDWEAFDVTAIQEAAVDSSTELSGNYYLTEDVVLGVQLKVKSDTELTICLNGHVLDFRDVTKAFLVSGTLNICDCRTDTVTRYGSYNEVYDCWEPTTESGTDNLKGGYITISEYDGIVQDGGVVVLKKGSFNFYSGNIAGVYITANSYDIIKANAESTETQTNIYNGNIFGNYINRIVVYCRHYGNNLNIYGGKISKNVAESIIYLHSAVKGYIAGEISENYSEDNSTIYLYGYSGNYSTLVLDGAYIAKNMTNYVSAGVLCEGYGNLTIRDTTITENFIGYSGSGAGVCVKGPYYANIVFEGKTIITGNTVAQTESNFAYNRGSNTSIKIGENGLSEGAQIGVEYTGNFSSYDKYRADFTDEGGATAEDLKYFISDRRDAYDPKVGLDFDAERNVIRLVVHKEYSVYFEAAPSMSGLNVDAGFLEEGSTTTYPELTLYTDPITRKIKLPTDQLYNNERAIFLGWYKGNTLFDENTELTQSGTTITAKWDYKALVTFAPAYGYFEDGDENKSIIVDPEVGKITPIEDEPIHEYGSSYFWGWSFKVNENTQDNIIDFTTQTFEMNKDYEVYPIWKKCWQIEHNADGGTFQSSGLIMPTNLTDRNDCYVEYPEVPVREGYNFMGWYTDFDGKGDKVEPGYYFGTYPGSGYVTKKIYAYWQEAPVSREILFDANGGAFEDGATQITLSTIAETGKLESLPEDPTRENALFLGWFDGTSSSANQVTLDTFFSSDSSLKVYAQWRVAVSVRFNANGGKFEDGSNSISLYTDINTGKIASFPQDPVRDNAIFLGWFNGTSSSATQITEDTVFSSNGYNVYAQWKVGYTITFNANGGTFPDGSTIITRYTNPLTGKLPALPEENPTKGKSIFLGWYTSRYNTNYKFDENLVYNGPQTVYAQWWDVYEITFNANGGEYSDGSATTILNTQGQDGIKGRLSAFPTENPTREGYTFVGWSSSSSENYEVTLTRTYSSNTTVYAYWQRIGANFNLCDGSGDIIVVADQGNGISAPKNVSWAPYILVGWATEMSEYSAITTTFTSPNHYYAVWARDNDNSGTYTDGDIIIRTNSLDLSEATEDIVNEEQGWAWDQDTLTLSLTNVEFMMQDDESLLVLPAGTTINLLSESQNTIDGQLGAYGALTIKGAGSLDVSDVISAWKYLTFEGVEVTSGYGIMCEGLIHVKSGKVVALYNGMMALSVEVENGAQLVVEKALVVMDMGEDFPTDVDYENNIILNGLPVSGANETFVEGTTLELTQKEDDSLIVIGELETISVINLTANESLLPEKLVPGVEVDDYYEILHNAFTSNNALIAGATIVELVDGVPNLENYVETFVEGVEYAVMIGLMPDYGTAFATDATLSDTENFTLCTMEGLPERYRMAYYSLGTPSYETISEVYVGLGDNFYDYYVIGGDLFNAPNMEDVFKVDATKPYVPEGLVLLAYNEESGAYEEVVEFDGFLPNVRYAISLLFVTGYDFTEMGGINATGYRFADEVTSVNEGWTMSVILESEGIALEATYELDALEVETINEIDISLSENFSNFYQIGGMIENVEDAIELDLTKPYFIADFVILVYDEETDAYDVVDNTFNGFLPNVKYAIATYIVTGYDFTEMGGINATGYRFADEVTNVNAGWTISVIAESQGVALEAIYELDVLEVETINEIDISLSENFSNFYYIGGNLYEEIENVGDIVELDLTKPYLPIFFEILVYDEETDAYDVVDNTFNGFLPNVKYAIATYIVTGYDFTEMGGINATGYRFANEVTNVNAGWTISVIAESQGVALEAIYELDVLEVETINEIDISLSENFSNFYYIGGTIENVEDIVELDLTKPYLPIFFEILVYDEETGMYDYPEDFNGFLINVKYAIGLFVITGENFTSNGGINATGYRFADEVTSVNEGWTISVIAESQGIALEALYELDVLVGAPVDSELVDITLTNALTYTGEEQIQEATIMYDGVTLVEGEDYTISGNSATNAGEYTLTINFIGDYSGTVTEQYQIAKATYDVSGITMSNKTVVYNGQQHSILVEGTLPSGVSVSYTNNNKVEAGVYNVTATFTGNANYEEIAPLSAVLIIKAVVVEHETKDEETGKPVVKVEMEEGFDPTLELVVEVVAVEIESTNIKVEISTKEDIAVAYDVTLLQDGVTVQPNGIIRIKMLVPQNLLGISFRIVHIHDGVEVGNMDYVVEDGYAIVETDKLSEFVFVYEPVFEKFVYSNPLIGWICLGVIALFAIALILIFTLKRTIKFDANGVIFENGEYGSIKARMGEKVKLPIPFAQGYNFVGWYYDKECKERAEITKMGAKNLTLYAKWDVITRRRNLDNSK